MTGISPQVKRWGECWRSGLMWCRAGLDELGGRSPGSRMWWELERLGWMRVVSVSHWNDSWQQQRGERFLNFTAAKWLAQGDRGAIWLVKQKEWTPIISWQCLKQKERRKRENVNECERIESLPDCTYTSFIQISFWQRAPAQNRAK